MSTQTPDDPLDQLRLRVAASPLDLGLRFQLGALLAERGDYNAAIPELQQARQLPQVRLRALELLGEAFANKGMLDLAAFIQRQRDDDPPDEDGPASAPVPAPLRPITPRDASAAKEMPNDNTRDG